MATATGSLFTKTYTTYSGVDITAIFDNIALSTLTGIAISVTREKAPVYTMGSANPRSISRGKRGTAGSMMFTLFDRDAFYSLFLDPAHYYYAHADEINWLTNPVNAAIATGLFYQSGFNNSPGGVAYDPNTRTGGTGLVEGPAGVNDPRLQNYGYQGVNTNNFTIQQGGKFAGTNNGGPVATTSGPNSLGRPAGGEVAARSVRKAAMYADQVMPFDITLVAQNEYGHASASGVIGVEIINEGGGISMDDITNEQQMTYIAIYRLPWYSLTEGTQRESIYGGVTRVMDTAVNGNQFTTNLTNNSALVSGQTP